MLKTLIILFALIVVIQPIPVRAAFVWSNTAQSFVWSNPALTLAVPQPAFAKSSPVLSAYAQAEQDSAHAADAAAQAAAECQKQYYPNQGYLGMDGNCYPEGSITDTAAIATTTVPVATTTATDNQSEIVKLLQQLIALETQLLQLQNSQNK